MAKRKALGTKAAANRFKELVGGRDLTGSQLLALRVASRIFCHFLNLSTTLFDKGELRKEDEEPKLALKTLVDYSDTYLKLVRYALDDAQAGSLADLTSLVGRKDGER